MNRSSKIFVAGHRGLVGSAIVRRLYALGYKSLLLKNRQELDLTDQQACFNFIEQERPEYIFLAAAKVGGIGANNKFRADFIYQNLQIQNNIIEASYRFGVKKLLMLGSSCIYPRDCPQPMKEDYLLTGPLEYTNEPYALAKIAGLKLCDSYNIQYHTNFVSIMPTNLYGPNDNFDLEGSHVLAALIRKFHLGKLAYEKDWDTITRDEKIFGKIPEDIKALLKSQEVTISLWGTGVAKREFLFVDDMAEASIFTMESIDFKKLTGSKREIRNTHLNVGTGIECSIKELADLVQRIVGFKGKVCFDSTKPDGTLRKLLDCSKINSFGWHHKVQLENGIELTYKWYKEKLL